MEVQILIQHKNISTIRDPFSYGTFYENTWLDITEKYSLDISHKTQLDITHKIYNTTSPPQWYDDT